MVVLAFVFCSCLVASPCRAETAVVRVITLKYRNADEAAVAVRPLLTLDGTLMIQPRLNTLTIRDLPRAVEKAVQAIAAFDLPPRERSIAVTLLRAGTGTGSEKEKTPQSEEMKVVGERLRKLFNFTDYATLDSVVVQSAEGEKVAYPISADYRIEFFLEPSGGEDLVRLKNLSLSRVKRQNGQETRREILRTSINVPPGQSYVLGIGKDESAQAALFLVFHAAIAPSGPGPGVGGLR